MLFPPRMLDVDMMQDEIGDHLQTVLMGRPDKRLKGAGITKMRLYLCGRDWPVAVIARIPAMGLGIFLIGHVRILVQWRDPERIDAKFPEITVPNLIFDPPPIAAVVIGGRLYVRIFDRVIVVLVAIPKPISQRIIHDGVLPMKCRRFAQRTAYDI